MTTINQLIYPQCVTCRRGLLPSTPSALGAVTLNVSRGWHLCGDCKGKGKSVLGGLAAVAGKVLEQRSPEAFKLMRHFYKGARGATQGAR